MSITTTLSEGQKLRIIRDDPQIRRMFDQLSKEERRFVLSAIEIGLSDENWIRAAIEDARELREEVINV